MHVPCCCTYVLEMFLHAHPHCAKKGLLLLTRVLCVTPIKCQMLPTNEIYQHALCVYGNVDLSVFDHV